MKSLILKINFWLFFSKIVFFTKVLCFFIVIFGISVPEIPRKKVCSRKLRILKKIDNFSILRASRAPYRHLPAVRDPTQKMRNWISFRLIIVRPLSRLEHIVKNVFENFKYFFDQEYSRIFRKFQHPYC